jgi:pimeloyl-ACP methyl ester carboxylesterase
MNKRSSQELPTAWHRAGARIELKEGSVFVRTEGNIHQAPPLLLLHGFPTSSHDYARVWARLALKYPLVTLDFIGFGASDKPAHYGYSLFEQADVVLEVVKHLGLSRVHLVAHDMGTSVATELCARRERGLLPLDLRSLTLTNGSVLIEKAQLTTAQKILQRPVLGELFARLSSYTLFQRNIRALLGTPALLEDEEIRVMWELLCRADGRARLPQLIHYIEERYRYHHRWIKALERLDLPTLILWGARDPVAVLPIGEELNRLISGSRLRILHELGHFPQLEDPGAFAGELLAFLGDSFSSP